MELIKELILLAQQLDQNGYYKLAANIDGLVKQAVEIPNESQKRFWAKVKKTPGCWIWTGAKDSGGYGVCTIGGKNYNTHRLAWEWSNGKKIPPGQVLLHSCDNPSCVRSEHLNPGTQISNVEDRVKKNRSARGKDNGRARLKKKDIKKIKSLRNKGWTESAIAQLFGVGRSTVSNILHGRTWNW